MQSQENVFYMILLGSPQLFSPEIGINDPVLDGVFHQVDDVVQVQFLHDVSTVPFNRFGTQKKNVGCLAD